MDEVKVSIAPGDTLSEIAARHGVSVEELQRLNRIEVPDLVQAGQTIVVHAPTNVPMSDMPVGDWDVWMVAFVVLAVLVLLFRRRIRIGTRRTRFLRWESLCYRRCSKP
ncbi:MAG: LysM domain-containing protein [Gammaproteobacteria bacterium]|nr:LysM domain-containing protein [Gammaproteobacteria bacterium]